MRCGSDGAPPDLYSRRTHIPSFCANPRLRHGRGGTRTACRLQSTLPCPTTQHPWHEQEARYSAFVQQAADKRLLLLEFGVGFNTPVIIRMPFERMAAQLPDTTLVRFNRDYPQPYQAGIEHFIPFTEDINHIIKISHKMTLQH